MYHTIDICQDIAEKLKNPSQVNQYRFESGTLWPRFSLTTGTTGIVCFLSAMDYVFPDQRWDDVTHQYLKEAVDSIDQIVPEGHSLYNGITGICFAAYLCSKRGSRYQKLLSKLENLLVQEIEKDLNLIRNEEIKNKKHVAPYRYNLMFGLTGIIAYLILRKDDARLLKLAKDAIQTLISLLTTQKEVNQKMVPGWFVAHEHIPDEAEKEKYPNGRFILTLPFGVTGCLSVLSLAAWEGIDTPKLYDTIKLLSNWINQKKLISSSELNWPYSISYESEIGEHPLPEFNMKSWCYGTPAVASSLCLAARVTRDKAIKNSAEEAFNQLFSKEWDAAHDASMGYGRAGLLAVTYRMAKLLDSGVLIKGAAQLEQEVKKLYNPSHPFGYQYRDPTSSLEKGWNEPGLLYGASGIALALLLATGRIDDLYWDRAFLIH